MSSQVPPPSYDEKNQPYNQPGYNQQQQSSQQQQYQQQPPQPPQQSHQVPQKGHKQQQQQQGEARNDQAPYIVVQHNSNIPPEPKKFGTCGIIGLYILCFIFPPISVAIVSPSGSDIIINLLLLLLIGVGSIIHGIYVVYKYTSGAASHKEWERQYGKRRSEGV